MNRAALLWTISMVDDWLFIVPAVLDVPAEKHPRRHVQSVEKHGALQILQSMGGAEAAAPPAPTPDPAPSAGKQSMYMSESKYMMKY